MLRVFIFLLFLSIPFWPSAQNVEGVVLDGEAKPLMGANIYWEGSTSGTTTNEKGEFSLAPITFPSNLIISFIGFVSDTIVLDQVPEKLQVQLKPSVVLEGITIEERVATSRQSTMSLINVEKISSKELQKAACCDLSESFETNASVDVAFTDAVSGTRKIRMLGLDGIYTQITLENIPVLRGLSSAYGLSYVPGTWIESIQVSKGAGSVVNGYESMTGQINLEYLKPHHKERERLFVNLYGNIQGRTEANVHLAHRFNSKWSSMLFIHGNRLAEKLDNNNDGFLDTPLKETVNVLNRWKYDGERYRAQLGLRVLSQELRGGQDTFDYSRDFGTLNAYGVGVDVKQAQVFFKQGIIFPNNPERSIALVANASYHDQQSYFGLKEYNGEQRTLFGNIIWKESLGERHEYKAGITYNLNLYEESYADSAFNTDEYVPGAYLEYEFNEERPFSLVAGIRGDWFNYKNWQVSPRLHLKYNFRPETVMRLSVGRGFRTARIFAENAAVLASSRRVITSHLRPEIAWNMGGSFTHEFKLINKTQNIHVEFFRTEFINQAVIDLENPDEVRFYNLDGSSYANSFQAEYNIELFPRFDVKTAYKWYDVWVKYEDGVRRKPLIPDHRALLNLGYRTKDEKWQADATGNWYGESRIPSTATNLVENRISTKSDNYYTINAQLTKRFRKLELYGGVENLLNYRQSNPIVAADEPFGDDFDASLIWGPVFGRNIYGGLRYRWE